MTWQQKCLTMSAYITIQAITLYVDAGRTTLQTSTAFFQERAWESSRWRAAKIGGPGCYSCNTLQYILGVLVLWDGCAICVIYDICIFSGSTKQYTWFIKLLTSYLYSPIKRYLSTEHMCVLICTPFHFLALGPSDLSRTKHPSTSWLDEAASPPDWIRPSRYGDNISSWICFLIWKVIVQVGVRPHIDD